MSSGIYELMKQIDVLVVFILIYGFAISGLVTIVTEIIGFFISRWKKHREKKTAKSGGDIKK